DNGHGILPYLDSTNGPRINGHPIQIRRLKVGDRVGIGRSILIFGSNEEIAARIAAEKALQPPTVMPQQIPTLPGDITRSGALDFDLNADEEADRLLAHHYRHIPRM